MAQYKIDIVFNNVPFSEGCTTDWGFACFVRGPEVNLLFDTGCDGDILLKNMRVMDIDPQEIDLIFISHMHYDHIGGLENILQANPHVKLFLPASATGEALSRIGEFGSTTVLVEKPVQVVQGIYSTGELGNEHLREQSLVIESESGLAVITGCAHPGIVQIVERAKTLRENNVSIVLGGFHMMRMNEQEIDKIVKQLQGLEVERIGPSHCTGEAAIRAFKQAWGSRFVDLGCGATTEFP